MGLLGQCLSKIDWWLLCPCSPRIISSVSTMNGCLFQRKRFLDSMGPCHALLNVPKDDSKDRVLPTRFPERFRHNVCLCHHALQMATNLIRCYGAFWKIQFIKTIGTQSRNWNSKSWQQWSATLAAVVRNFRSRLQMVIDADVVCTHCKKCLHDCESPKTTELGETKYSNVCHVLR
jgi:hypothetical protein